MFNKQKKLIFIIYDLLIYHLFISFRFYDIIYIIIIFLLDKDIIKK